MTIPQVVLATISITCFLALFTYISLISFGYGRTLHRSSSRAVMVFLPFVAVGFLVCLYEGAEAMLFWIPSEWGFVGVEGDQLSTRTYIAVAFTLLGGIAFLLRIEQVVSQDSSNARPLPSWFGMARTSAPWSKSRDKISSLDENRR